MYKKGSRAEMSVSIGNRYSRLIVVEKIYKGDFLHKCICKCDCGNESIPWAQSLKLGRTHSCGCFCSDQTRQANRTHGKRNSKVYFTWVAMKNRTLNPKHKWFHRYGGRGISCSERWKTFENFYNDMGDPKEGQSLERIDNEKGYSKKNCKWASWNEQAINRKGIIFVEYDGVKDTAYNIWERFSKPKGLGFPSFYKRLKKGMCIDEVINKPRKEPRLKGMKMGLSCILERRE